MSRSYRKGYTSFNTHRSEDKWFRQCYNRNRRAKDNRILKECETYYKDCETFKPYEELCCLCHEVCDIDSDIYWLDKRDPHDVAILENNIVNPGTITEDDKYIRLNRCMGCYWSTNHTENWDQWDVAPDEQFVNNKIDHSVRYSDTWGWPSDGRYHHKEDKVDLRKEINEDLFSEETNHYSHKSIWDDYCEYRENKFNKEPCKWKLVYKVPVREKLARELYGYTHLELEWGKAKIPSDKNGCRYNVAHTKCVDTNGWDEWTIYKTYKTWDFETVEKVLDHRPYVSDLPKGAWLVSVHRLSKWAHSQPKSDWGFIEFCFYRNIIPTTFKTREELTAWVLKHEEEIVDKWYRVKNRK